MAAWKTQIIDAIFLPHEAELIKSIPLSSRLPEDTTVWAATPNGLFTIRSAYRLAMEQFDQAIEVLTRTLAKPVDSGRGYGDCRFPIRCVTSHGEPADTYYQLRRIFSGGESSWTFAVRSARRTLSPWDTYFGLVAERRTCGNAQN